MVATSVFARYREEESKPGEGEEASGTWISLSWFAVSVFETAVFWETTPAQCISFSTTEEVNQPAIYGTN